MSNIGDICNREVISVIPTTTVLAAAQLLRYHQLIDIAKTVTREQIEEAATRK